MSLMPWVDRDWHEDWPLQAWDDTWMSPWESPRRHRGWNPWKEMNQLTNRLFRDVEGLKRHAFMDTGIVPRKDAYEVSIDVKGFDPKELQVNVNDNFLTLTGRHEEKSQDGSSYVSRSFQRMYQLPKNVNQDAIRSSLTDSGKTLRVEAPMLAVEAQESKPIPIEISRGNPAITNGSK